MAWNEFMWFALPALICWAVAAMTVYRSSWRVAAEVSMAVGIVAVVTFIVVLWVDLGRPPLRTLGETRLWYAFFISLVGFAAYKLRGYKWLLSFSAVMGGVFLCINLFRPEIHSAGLMPALQSHWFIPHVTVYILSYAMLGAAAVAAIVQLYGRDKADGRLGVLTDDLVYAGYGLLMLGMIMGAMWAKEAWGQFWSWDPKETWAFITAAAYLVYIHMRLRGAYPRFTLWMLPIAFILLMITWIGVNYLPSAQGSIHVY